MSVGENGSSLDFVLHPPAERVRYLVLVVATMTAFSLLGGLLAVPFDAVIPDGEVGSLLENLLPFVGTLVLLVVIIRTVMHRPMWTFAAPDPAQRWPLFARGALIQICCMAVNTAVFAISPVGSLEVSAPNWSTFVVVVPIALVGFLVQSGVEELVFRGTLPQATRRFTSHVVVVYALPALVFAGLHTGNVSALENGALALLPYFLMASLWGWVSYRTASLWTSWGMHYANNVYLVLLIGSHDDVATPISGIDFVYAHPNAESILATSLFGLALSATAIWYFVLRHQQIVSPAESPRPTAPDDV